MPGPPPDYVDVATRLAEAFHKYPELRVVEHEPVMIAAGDHLFVQVGVTIHRDPDDPVPCTAHAWEPFPGKTAFVRDSEMMNASTSAVGRALGLMGFGAKRSIASADEVRTAQARQPAPAPKQERRLSSTDAAQEAYFASMGVPGHKKDDDNRPRATGKGAPTEKMLRYAHALLKGAGRDKADFDLDTFDGCKAAIEELKAAAATAEEPF